VSVVESELSKSGTLVVFRCRVKRQVANRS